LLFDDSGYRICEVNSSPGFEGMEKFTKINIAEKIVNYVRLRLGILEAPKPKLTRYINER
jgi:gamma-F420-2:alpha-L-glutamate ligase